jgi:photosynthetic reaction center cytochrome c subunit
MTSRTDLACLMPLVLLAGCELGAKQVEQTGYRGQGLEQIYDPDNFKQAGAIPPEPYPLPADEGPRAREVYQNVQVLGDLSAERFNHLMASITAWVSPEQGCNYCHNPNNLASDEVYTKNVARRMLQMTRGINGRWSTHVQETGVTCYTCHRGQPVPQYIWAQEPMPDKFSVRGQKRGQNTPAANVGYASLPYSAFQRYLSGDPGSIRVASDSPYPGRNSATTRDAEDSYAIMMHTSKALGVNCTYCHNSQSFRSWSLSRAQRATAWYGIRMVRDINFGYIQPLQGVFPANRKGPMGDPYKVNCLTCHQNQAKPLGGVSMLAQYPYMRSPAAMQAAQPIGGAGNVPAVLDRPAAISERILPGDVPQQQGQAQPVGSRESTPPATQSAPAQ